MNSALRTTFLMLLITIGMVIAARYFYPWLANQQFANQINEPLFPEYNASDVRGIQIETFEFVGPNEGAINKFVLTNNAERWVMPKRSNFPAGSASQIVAATGALRNLIIEAIVKDDAINSDDTKGETTGTEDSEKTQKGYGLYGVNDPNSEAAGGKGTLIKLEGKDGDLIASLIVGLSPEGNPDQRYVRVPGQLQVYLVRFNANAISTNFSDWVDTNLFRLTQKDFAEFKFVEINSYEAGAKDFAKKGEVKNNYRLNMSNTGQGIQADVWLADENGNLLEDAKSVRIDSGSEGWFARFNRQLGAIRFVNVKPKQDIVARHLINPEQEFKEIEFSSMINNGFRYAEKENGQHQFVAAGGVFELMKGNGVLLKMYFGGKADPENGVGVEAVRYAFLVAEVDPEILKEPVKVEADDPTKTDREHAAKLKLWQESADKAKSDASAFNRVHAKWFYLVNESSYMTLVPDLVEVAPALAKKTSGKKATEEKPAEEKPAEDKSAEDRKD